MSVARGLTGLGGMAQQSGGCAGLCRPGGRGPVEQRLCVCGSPAWQALGLWPGRAGIVQACAGQRAWPSGEHECLWISRLAGLKGLFGGDHVGLRGGVWGSTALVGLRSRAGRSEVPQHAEQWVHGLWGGAWHAAPAILLVYGGVEKPSRS
jgi:hypothetical protein